MFTERKQCPLCRSHQLEQIYEYKADDRYYNFVTSLFHNYILNVDIPNYVLCRCKNCHTLFQKYILSKKYEKDLYTTNVFHNFPQFIHDKEKDKDCYYFATKELDIINNLTNSTQCYILDFGAMYGQFGRYMSAYNHKVDSYDIMTDNDQYTNALNDNYDIIRIKDTLSHIQNNLYTTVSDLVKRLKNNRYFIIIDYFVNKNTSYNYMSRSLLPFWHTQIFDINSFTKFGLKLKIDIPFSIRNHPIIDMKVDEDTRYIVYEKITS
jgi:hypothetical protein